MIFGTLPLHEAEGAVLAHTRRLPDRVLKKGAVLDAAALGALRAAGVEDVVAAKLEPGDVGENEAADRLAAMTPPGHHAIVHVTLTDDHPWAQAFVVIEARPHASQS